MNALPSELDRLVLALEVTGKLLVIFSAPILSIVLTHFLTRKR